MIAITELINLLNKPALTKWANKIGLEGINIEDYRKKSTSQGTLNHKSIENYLINNIKFEGHQKLDELLSGYSITGIEKNINNGFICGRCDLLLEKNNKKIVVDFKANNSIYLNHKLQLSAYKEILNADSIAIINYKDWRFNIITIDTKKYYQIIKNLYVIKNHLNQLNEKL